jgi:predicted outer membrane repeat protein
VVKILLSNFSSNSVKEKGGAIKWALCTNNEGLAKSRLDLLRD